MKPVWEAIKGSAVSLAAMTMAGPFANPANWKNIKNIWSTAFCKASGATFGVVTTFGLLLAAASLARYLVSLL
ncbi:hypothetical protein D3C85_1073070 [compost metagenome]